MSELAVALPWLRMLQVTRGAIAAETAAALPSDLKSLPKMKAQTETLNFETGTPKYIFSEIPTFETFYLTVSGIGSSNSCGILKVSRYPARC